MISKDTDLSMFELDAVNSILDSDAPDLGPQLSQLGVEYREHTGVGEYVYFFHEGVAREVDSDNRTLGKQVFADVKGIKHGVGLILYVDRGLISMLEIFSHAGEELPHMIEGKVRESFGN